MENKIIIIRCGGEKSLCLLYARARKYTRSHFVIVIVYIAEAQGSVRLGFGACGTESREHLMFCHQR